MTRGELLALGVRCQMFQRQARAYVDIRVLDLSESLRMVFSKLLLLK